MKNSKSRRFASSALIAICVFLLAGVIYSKLELEIKLYKELPLLK